jgi:hypothetical protein
MLDDGVRVLSCDSAIEILEANSPKQVQRAIDGWTHHPTMRAKGDTALFSILAIQYGFTLKPGGESWKATIPNGFSTPAS